MDKLGGVFARLKRFKHKETLLCIVAVAAVLIVYYACVSCSDKTERTASDYSDRDYCSAMQIRLEQVVSEIKGVGSAAVVISWDRSVASSFSGGATENPKATGALIVCDGGANTKVKLDVMYAVSTLLDLSIEKISVYPKSK